MMQLLCNGVVLDLKKGATLSFKKSNILFAFDDVECERSVSFDLPGTPTNEQVFGLAKDPAFGGQGMRQKFTAELRDGVVVKSGYLHVEQYAGGSYKAVFVCGELTGLQALRDAGKISDLLTYDDVALWTTTTYSPYYRSILWEKIAYTRKGGALYPSVNLKTILQDALTALGVTYALPIDDELTGMRLIPASLNGFAEQSVEFVARQTREMTQGGTSVIITASATEASTILSTDTASVMLTKQQGSGGAALTGKVTQFVAKQDLTLTFPDDWDDDLFVGFFLNGGSNLIGEFTFLGDRSFNEYGTVTGDSLRGRSVDVAYNTKFVIINKNAYANFTDSGGTIWKGWFYGNGYGVGASFTMSGKIGGTGRTVRLQDNLPEQTVVELLKVVQAVTGKQLYYDGAVSFDALDFSTWQVVELTDKLLPIDKVQRTFGKYAQTNYVRYDSSEYVQPSNKIETTYTISNENLEAESDLQVIPYSEGNANGVYLVTDENDAETLAYADANLPAMKQMPLTKSSSLQALCTQSTTVEAKVWMTLQDWEMLTPKTVVQVQGLRYVWTEGNWSKGVAQLSLSKI